MMGFFLGVLVGWALVGSSSNGSTQQEPPPPLPGPGKFDRWCSARYDVLPWWGQEIVKSVQVGVCVVMIGLALITLMRMALLPLRMVQDDPGLVSLEIWWRQGVWHYTGVAFLWVEGLFMGLTGLACVARHSKKGAQ